MKGHVIISHGLDSSPEATKATALARQAEQLGWSHERPDYQYFDQQTKGIGRLGDVRGRIAHLEELARRAPRPLVLAGSSLGAFVSARVSLAVPVLGLFLMAPPVRLDPGYGIALEAKGPAWIVHGWDDELIDALEVVTWAKARRDHLILVNDSHRLAAHVDFCAQEFGRFLQAFS